MYLTDRAGLKSSRGLLRAFGGLNETYSCSEAEYSQGLNFSARNFPALSTRTPRRRLSALSGLNGMYHLNGLLTICGTQLTYTPDDSSAASVTIADAVADSKKQLAAIGTKVLIFPDKLAFDTADGSLSKLGASWSGEGLTVTFAPCDAEGNTYEATGSGTAEPESPEDGQVFLKITTLSSPWGNSAVLEVYSLASGNWTAVNLNYCLISATGIGANFKQWDTVTLSGALTSKTKQWGGLNGDLIVCDLGDDWLRVKADLSGEKAYGTLEQLPTIGTKWTSLDGSASRKYTTISTVTLERRIPDLDFLTECDNRVWGCSSSENVIYSCKLGDASNWFSYRGTAADSYSVTVGSDGPFTGAATCMGYALFFKENTVHKLYGSKPSDFQLTAMRCRGVAKNASRSLCVLNETLYYLSPEGVMAWDGSIPTKVSTALDASRLANVQSAVGGALDGRYYLYLSRLAGTQQQERLLVYDTEKGLWHEEDVCGQDMSGTGGRLYLWDGAYLWAADPSREADWQSTDGVEQSVSFELTTGDIGIESAEERLISRMTLRVDAEADSTIKIEASYDGGEWETLRTVTVQTRRRCRDIAFVPRRHRTMRLRFSGTGQITLRAIAKTTGTAKGSIIQD